MAMTTLPRPTVDVTVDKESQAQSIDVVVKRDGKAQTYSGKSETTVGAVGDLVNNILNDPKTIEWLP